MNRSPAAELVDVVDGDGVVIDTVTRARMRAERLRHRAVFVIIRSGAGEILIHRRSDAKDLWPGRWDLGVGGVVAAGESYAVAAARELSEEVGVRAPLEEIGSGTYADDDVDLLARIYEARHDGPFHFDDGEVVEARFVTVDELRRLTSIYSFVPDSLALLGELL